MSLDYDIQILREARLARGTWHQRHGRRFDRYMIAWLARLRKVLDNGDLHKFSPEQLRIALRTDPVDFKSCHPTNEKQARQSMPAAERHALAALIDKSNVYRFRNTRRRADGLESNSPEAIEADRIKASERSRARQRKVKALRELQQKSCI